MGVTDRNEKSNTGAAAAGPNLQAHMGQDRRIILENAAHHVVAKIPHGEPDADDGQRHVDTSASGSARASAASKRKDTAP